MSNLNLNEAEEKKNSHLESMYFHPNFHNQPMEKEMSFLDFWKVIKKGKWKIFLIVLLTTSLALVYSLVATEKYIAEVTLMPVSSKKGGGMSSMLSQLSSVPLLGGQVSGIAEELGGSKNKELISILKSRTFSESIIQKYGLMKVFFKDLYNKKTDTYNKQFFGLLPAPVLEDAVEVFQKKISKIKDKKKDGLISIQIKMADPVLGAKVANGMILELQDFLSNNSITVEKRNRIFIEEQLVKNGAKLLEAGKALNRFYTNNRISSAVPELNVLVGSYEALPEAFEEIRKQIKAIENQANVKKDKSEKAIVEKVPSQVYLEYLTLNRELLIKSHALLTQQYELAKIEEAQEDLGFQVIDKAVIKQKPDSPKLILNLVVGLVGGLLLGLAYVVFKNSIEKQRALEE